MVATIVSVVTNDHPALESRLDERLDTLLSTRLDNVHQTLASASAAQTEGLPGAILASVDNNLRKVTFCRGGRVSRNPRGGRGRLKSRRSGHQSRGAQSRRSGLPELPAAPNHFQSALTAHLCDATRNCSSGRAGPYAGV